jgi:hypothetical protein
VARLLAVPVALLVASCHSSSAPTPPDGGRAAHPSSCTLFGRPNDKTGLTPDQCKPECACGEKPFSPPDYDAAFIRSLAQDWVSTTPFPPLDVDPYAGASSPPEDPAGTVCAVLPQGDAQVRPRPYSLVTYGSEAEARNAGAHPTHFGHCGVCSTLENLAVYMRENDLTAPVRACGLVGITDGGAANVACLRALGFDLPCAQAWYYDTLHTRAACLDVCLNLLDKPYQLPDGGLNACIQCDEDQSGPIFKAVAGRTRRNSGLPNALCRPCSEVQPLVHAY